MTEEKKTTVKRVEVTVAKEGWVHRGEAMKVGGKAKVTEAQAKQLKEKGLVK